jgi:hypothetical protein
LCGGTLNICISKYIFQGFRHTWITLLQTSVSDNKIWQRKPILTKWTLLRQQAIKGFLPGGNRGPWLRKDDRLQDPYALISLPLSLVLVTLLFALSQNFARLFFSVQVSESERLSMDFTLRQAQY